MTSTVKLLIVLKDLQESPEGKSINSLAIKHKLSIKQVKRYLNNFKKAGFNI